MKRKMMHEYLKTTFGAVLVTLVVGILLCYVLLLTERSADENMPQYLVANIYQYLIFDGEHLNIDSDGMQLLKDHECWLQMIDAEGKVVGSINANKKLPDYYSVFDLVRYTLKSGQLDQDTLFICEVSKYPGYSVIIGCDQKIIRKYSIIISCSQIFLKVCIIFLVTMVLVVYCTSTFFSKKITTPIIKIIDDIHLVSAGVRIEELDRHSMFFSVSRCLVKLQNRLEENKKMRAEWISNISHDMKTPLSTIRGYSEMLEDPGYQFDFEEIRSYAKEISRSEQYIENLINDLRLSQKLEEGRLPLHKEKIELYTLLEDCIAKVGHLIKGDSQIILDCEDTLLLECDQNLMSRCITNIIGNALFHNPNGVRVEIHAAAIQDGIKIEICDDGKGMSEEETKYIFARYYRGTSSQQQEGTGLGLAIARETVEAHAGTIEVESAEGKGSKFIIKL